MSDDKRERILVWAGIICASFIFHYSFFPIFLQVFLHLSWLYFSCFLAFSFFFFSSKILLWEFFRTSTYVSPSDDQLNHGQSDCLICWPTNGPTHSALSLFSVSFFTFLRTYTFHQLRNQCIQFSIGYTTLIHCCMFVKQFAPMAQSHSEEANDLAPLHYGPEQEKTQNE